MIDGRMDGKANGWIIYIFTHVYKYKFNILIFLSLGVISAFLRGSELREPCEMPRSN